MSNSSELDPMSDLTELNNNNYMPGFYGETDPVAPHNMSATINMRGGLPPQPFTFTSPTHSNSMTTPRPNIQTTSQIGPMSAPGVGTTWQHSVPSTMPWASHFMANSSQHRLPSGDDQIMPATGFSSIAEPQPSCSSPLKRPKRKALETPEDAPTSKVYLCADQLANLQINTDKGSEENSGLRRSIVSYHLHPDSSRSSRFQDLENWERFKELENSIDVDSDGEGSQSKNAESHKKGVLCIDEKFVKDPNITSSSLPKTVLEDITRPCLQVVLWKSPGQLLRDVVSEDSPILPPSASLSTSTLPSSLLPNPKTSRSDSWLSSSPVPSLSSSSSLASKSPRLSRLHPPPSLSADSCMDVTTLNTEVTRPGILPSPWRLSPSPIRHSSANACLLSPSAPNLNWLQTASNLASSTQALAPIGLYGDRLLQSPGTGRLNNSDFLDDDIMQL